MTSRPFRLSLLVLLLVASAGATRAEEKNHALSTVTLHKMADALHAVIAADQETLVNDAAAGSSGAGATKPMARSHAERLRIAAQSIQTKGAEFSYTLRSLQPINANNGPQTEAEQIGLATVSRNPGEPFYADEQLGGRSYFTAVYAMRASSNLCIECHNGHPQSPRHDLKPGDVMGAIVIRLPLEF
jgi:hypothetical protein